MNLQKLRQEQERLASKVLTTDQFEEIQAIGGCDQAFVGDKIISAVVVIDAKTLEILESTFSVQKCVFPYIQGYVSYREAPAVVEAFNKLSKKPDILLCDADGILHPRRLGLASHLGIALDVPTIGVAKTLVIGENSGGKIIVDKEIRAIEFVSREHVRPLYISPGHKVSLNTAVSIVRNCMKYPHKMPEPLHLAYRYATKLRIQHEEELGSAQPAKGIAAPVQTTAAPAAASEEDLDVSEIADAHTPGTASTDDTPTSPSPELLSATQ